MIKDTKIHTLPASMHVQSDGSNIGGVEPSIYGYSVLPSRKEPLRLFTKGSKIAGEYPAFMWYPLTLRRFFGDSGSIFNCKLSIHYRLLGDLNGVNVIETDTLFVLGGYKYNCSLQYNHASGFQIADVHGNWVDTGFNPGNLEIDHWYNIKVLYKLDTIQKQFSVRHIRCGNLASAVPSNLLSVPATISNWKEGVYPQIQLGSMPTAEEWGLEVKKMSYSY